MGSKRVRSSGIPDAPLPPLLLALDVHWTKFPGCCGRLDHYATEENPLNKTRAFYCKCGACGKLIEVVVKY